MIWKSLQGPVQIAYAVDDVVGAAESWVARGAGPFFIRQHIHVENSRMHGTQAAFDHSSAYGQYGDLMIELLCEHHNDVDRIGPRGGVHHMAYFVDDIATAQAALVAEGYPEVLYAKAGKTVFAMHDATADLGHLIEIYRDSNALVSFYDMVRAARETWNGEDAIRFL